LQCILWRYSVFQCRKKGSYYKQFVSFHLSNRTVMRNHRSLCVLRVVGGKRWVLLNCTHPAWVNWYPSGKWWVCYSLLALRLVRITKSICYSILQVLRLIQLTLFDYYNVWSSPLFLFLAWTLSKRFVSISFYHCLLGRLIGMAGIR